jgi:hypothetical protein
MIQNIQINAATTKHTQCRNKMTKPQTNTFSKYCEDKPKKKKYDIKYTHIIQGPYNTE